MEEEILRALQQNLNQTSELLDYLKGGGTIGQSPTTNNNNNNTSGGIPRLLQGGFFAATKAMRLFADTANNSSGNFARSVDDIGKLLPGSVTQVTGPLAQLTQTSYEVNQNLRNFGIELGDNIFDIQEFAGALNMTDQELRRFADQYGDSFVKLGVGAEEGFKGLIDFRKGMDETGIEDSLIALGLQFDELNEYTLNYLARRGIADLQDEAAQRRRMADMLMFRAATQEFAEVTGRSADEAAKQADDLAKTQGAFSYELRNGREAAANMGEALASMGLEQFADFAYRGFNVAAAADPESAAILGPALKELSDYGQRLATGAERDVALESRIEKLVSSISSGYLADPASSLIPVLKSTLEVGNTEFYRGITRSLQDIDPTTGQSRYEENFRDRQALQAAEKEKDRALAQLDAEYRSTQMSDDMYYDLEKQILNQFRAAQEEISGSRPVPGSTRDSMLDMNRDIADAAAQFRTFAGSLNDGPFKDALKELSDALKAGVLNSESYLTESETPRDTAVAAYQNTIDQQAADLQTALEKGLITQEEYDKQLAALAVKRETIPVDVMSFLGETTASGFNSADLQTTDTGSLKDPDTTFGDILESIESMPVIGPALKRFTGSSKTPSVIDEPSIQMDENKLKSQTQENNLPSNNDQSLLQLNKSIETLIEKTEESNTKLAALGPALSDFGNKTAGAMGSAARILAEKRRTDDLSNSIQQTTGVMTG